MRRDVRAHALWLAAAALITLTAVEMPRAQAPAPAQAPLAGVDLVRATYTKYEYMVPMRDGVRLFTAVYAPKDASQTISVPDHAHALQRRRRTASISTRAQLGPSEHFQKEGFIFVYQDARGRYMSEGEFQQVRPFNARQEGPKDIDESTDTYDTIEWLLKNVPNHNGRAGMVGISQPGFHVAASIIDSHPALKAASPQAPTADYYMGDDVYHNGAFMLGANFGFYSSFVARGATPEPPQASGAVRSGHAGHVRVLPANAGAACAHERRALRRQGGVLAGDRRSHDLRRVLEEALACGGSWTA